MTSYVKRRDRREERRALNNDIMSDAQVYVLAAEQLNATGVIDDKLDYVQKGLRKRGYELDADYTRAIIEAEVKKLSKNQSPALLLGHIEEAYSGEAGSPEYDPDKHADIDAY